MKKNNKNTMCPERANIFIIEDSSEYLSSVKNFLELNDHTVVDSASTVDEAFTKIPLFQEENIDVVLLDGNLSKNRTNCEDGEIIAKAIHDAYPNLAVIGHATEHPLVNANVNSLKTEGPVKLSEIIKNI